MGTPNNIFRTCDIRCLLRLNDIERLQVKTRHLGKTNMKKEDKTTTKKTHTKKQQQKQHFWGFKPRTVQVERLDRSTKLLLVSSVFP